MTSTPVTVTMPIRGSFSSPTPSATTARTDSFTLRMRSVTVATGDPSVVSGETSSRSQRTSTQSPEASQRSAPSASCSASPAARPTQAAVSVARCQRSWWSTSATAAPKRLRRLSFAERT